MNFLTWVNTHRTEAAEGLAIGATILAFLTLLLNKVIHFLVESLSGYLIVTKELEDDFTVNVVLHYMLRHAKHYSVNKEVFEAGSQTIYPLGDDRVVLLKKNSRSYCLFLYRWIPILLTPSKLLGEGLGHQDNAARFFRWTVDWDKLLCSAAKYWDDTKEPNTKGVFRVTHHMGSRKEATSKRGDLCDPPDESPSCYDHQSRGSAKILNWLEEDLRAPVQDSLLDILSLNGVMLQVIQDVKFWLDHKDWYNHRKITWKRGYLLHGLPGNGKTSLVRALAEDLALPVHIFDLCSMDNWDFAEAWKESNRDTPRIVLLEDFDTVFEGRENKLPDSTLSFDTILNAIDGIEKSNGLLLFVTTNKIKAIDAAIGTLGANGMSTRPGRIDKIVEILGPDFEGRLKIARRILEDESLAQELALKGEGDAAAQFQERCMLLALERFWQIKEED